METVQLEDPEQLALEWANWLERWRCECRPTSLPVNLNWPIDAENRLAGFLGWWREAQDVPAKLPNALQVRTAVYLTVRSIETGVDLTGGLLTNHS